jgi:hypothetical protein
MATIIRGDADARVQALKDALDAYEAEHADAQASLYRHNPGSIRLRVVDCRFERMPKSRRHAHVWDYLAARVPEDTMAEISLLLTISPAELQNSFANSEFEEPIPSKL